MLKLFAIALAVLALALAGVAIAYRISPLHTFNTLAPRDGGSTVAARGIAFGSHERQRLDIYRPRIARDGAPVIVFFYGGSWNSGTRTGYDFVGRALAAQGFITVIPDYRLVPGVVYPAFLEDGAAAVRWVRENIAEHDGDPDRIVLMGHSAGAYNAAMLALDPRWLGQDRSAIRGMVGLAGPYDFLPLDTPATRAAFGQEENLAETQPVTHASASAPPLLLLTGEDDRTVRPRNSESLARALTEAGGKAEVVRYDGVDHIAIVAALSRPLRRRAPVLEDAVRFARRVTATPSS